MTWRAIYDTADGRLHSVGTVWTDPPRAGTDFKEFAEKPDDASMWDEVTRAFVPRPPKVLIDRMDDLEGHPTFTQFSEVFDSLTNQQKAKVRNAIRKMLGAEQFRNVSGSVEIGK
ncbi:hypothetical protein LCGC14_1786190 [marine sediment metagenome]|uniref:Uncharacterized protein n=1 Tax=marine sediment metagenome TaxID=412755 RepID=A0A0F9GU44_9ZZZZ